MSTIAERIEKANSHQPEALTASDEQAMKQAEAEGFDSGLDLDTFIQSLEGYSGKLVLRLPRSLHKRLKLEAEAEGVSLNQYMLYKLAQ